MIQPPIKHIDANGLRFAYFEYGQGPLVLCLHGFPDTPHTWSHLAPILARRHRVVTPFMRGYLPTEIPKNKNISPLTLGRDVLALIRALGEQQAVIIGHDWGAAAVYAAAALDPDAVSRMIAVAIPPPIRLLTSPSVVWGFRHFIAFQRRQHTLTKIRADDFEHLAQIYRRWSPTWDLPHGALDHVKACFSQPHALEAALSYYWSFFGVARDPEARRLIRAPIRVPSLIIGGDADGALKPGLWRRLDRAFDAPFEVTLMRGVGHFLHLEDPVTFAQHVTRFLDSSKPST